MQMPGWSEPIAASAVLGLVQIDASSRRIGLARSSTLQHQSTN
jgi:hypothetical protein